MPESPTVLVTGATGFIGRRLVPQLVSRGLEVRAMTRHPERYDGPGTPVGADVTELIQGFVIAMNLETTEEELIQTVFPHPTLSETMHESVLAAYGRVIHV